MKIFLNGSALVLRLAVSFLYFLCVFLEYYAFRIIFSQNDSLCIVGHEISEEVRLFLTFDYSALVTDMVLALAGLLLWKLYNASIGVIYNVVMAVVCSYTAYKVASALTCCFNPAMDFINCGAMLGTAAATVHIAIAVGTHFMIENDDGYYLGREEEGACA